MRVIGAGPAGSTAALSARREGAPVEICEKSVFPRHKVCGEFLSPEAALIFDRLGILPGFLALRPFAVRQANVSIGRAVKRWTLEEPAFGISRFTLDRFLLSSAQSAGATLVHSAVKPEGGPLVIASGRRDSAPAGHRLFGFKAHFTGPLDDRIDLLFDRDVYVGINCVENGATNVCALASEPLLRRYNFEPDALIAATPALAARIGPLTRSMPWLITGPLVYGGRFDARTPPDVYLAGDALGFVDPFTGSGMLGALSTGFLAGRSCAHGIASSSYLEECRRLLGAQYRNAALLRRLLAWGIAEKLAWLLPGRRLFQLTRPAVSQAI